MALHGNLEAVVLPVCHAVSVDPHQEFLDPYCPSFQDWSCCGGHHRIHRPRCRSDRTLLLVLLFLSAL